MQSLILGTAQWGLDYGITNPGGRLSDAAVAALADAAEALSIAALDTAPGYGDAEVRVGALAGRFLVQTKVSAAGGGAGIRASLEASRRRLGIATLWSVLVHDWPELTPALRTETAGVLEEERAAGRVLRVGISGYTADDLASALGSFERLDVAQLPVSILDQRLAETEVVAELRLRGGSFQARSVLLQGVASGAESPFSDHPAVQRLNIDGEPLALALAFIRAQDWVDEVVLGATSAEELTALAYAWAQPPRDESWEVYASTDEHLLDPRTWRSQA